MYYLAVQNLGIEKCIDKNIDDIYENNQYYSYLTDFSYVKNKLIKRIKIKCVEMPGPDFNAIVYSD